MSDIDSTEFNDDQSVENSDEDFGDQDLGSDNDSEGEELAVDESEDSSDEESVMPNISWILEI